MQNHQISIENSQNSQKNLIIFQSPYYSECCDIIERLLEGGINFVALDFDQTIIDIHTANHPTDSLKLEIIEPHIRPFFRTFLNVLLMKSNSFFPSFFLVFFFLLVCLIACSFVYF